MTKTTRPILNNRNYILPDGIECIPYARWDNYTRMCKVLDPRSSAVDLQTGEIDICNLCVPIETLRQAKLVPKGEESFLVP